MNHITTEKISITPTDFPEEKVLLKAKCQAILSLIACFQHKKKNIQRAHLISALVKNPNPSSDDKNLMEKDVINQLQTLGKTTPKIMFNSIAHLDKTIQKLRKLGLITNQYMRGYPRIILTHKGHMVFYSLVYPSLIFKMITELFNKLH
ncbi:Uncharacterised protein [uncultured archaeon]|nr:Uncharacterised protein [uncultured archaeon]